MKNGREIELKLVLDETGAERLRDHPALNGLPSQAARQVSTYYDTQGGAIREAGFSLRVRETKGRFIQTVKYKGQDAAGMFDRPEWEEEIGCAEPDLDLARRTPLGAHLGKEVRKKLRPLVRSDMERTSWRAEADGADIEVTLDEGTVTGRKSQEQVTELELELKSGNPKALVGLARDIAEQVPVRLGVLTKAERGYRLADGKNDTVTKAEPIALSRDMSVADGFVAIAASCIRQFRLNETVVAGTRDPAALHQSRVAMRRLRSAFSFFRPIIDDAEFAELRGEVKWFTEQLGNARNLDVLLKRAPRDSEGNAGDIELIRALETARARAYKEVLDVLGSPRLRLLMIDLVGWLETGAWRDGEAAARPLAEFGRARLDRRWRRVRKGGRDIRTMEAEPLHRLRIEVKKLRYAVEFLASLNREEDQITRRKAFSAALEDMQESLGAINDVETARELLASFAPARSLQSLDHWLRSAADDGDARDAAADAYARLVEAAGPYWR